MRTQSLLCLSFCAVALLMLYGCAKLQDTPPVPVAPGITVHPAGWADSTSQNFHGKYISAHSWDMRPCRTCHGQNYAGGAVKSSCLACHTQDAGPENCSTCHGSINNPAPPKDLAGDTVETALGVGAHQVHLNTTDRDYSTTQIACSDCHHVPGYAYDPSHLPAQLPANVLISSPLGNKPTSGFTPSPTFDPNTGKCSSVYCHGAWRLRNNPDNPMPFMFVSSDSTMRGASYTPQWNGGGDQAACGTCHGSINGTDTTYVPVGHAAETLNACYVCHTGVVDINGNIIDKSKHINGKIDLLGNEYDFK